MMTENKFSVHVSYDVVLTEENIDDIVCTALEGGITYWCSRCEVIGESLGEWAHEQIARGGMLKLYIDEEVDGDTKWWLNREKFLAGFNAWIENGDDLYGAVSKVGVDTCQIDACMADSIIQYALFGEVVFGGEEDDT